MSGTHTLAAAARCCCACRFPGCPACRRSGSRSATTSASPRIVAIGLVVLTGVGGMTSFGQASFVGFGAYTTAMLTVQPACRHG